MLLIILSSKPSLLCYKNPTQISLNSHLNSTIAKPGGHRRFYLITVELFSKIIKHYTRRRKF